MQDVKIKRAKTDDEILSVASLKQADDSECTRQAIPEETALQRVVEWREMSYDVWIAESDGIVVGYAVGKRVDEAYLSYGIYVMPFFRRKGIGTMLKAAQVDHARECGCEYIRSSVSKSNVPSIRVQEKHGFEFETNIGGYIVSKRLRY